MYGKSRKRELELKYEKQVKEFILNNPFFKKTIQYLMPEIDFLLWTVSPAEAPSRLDKYQALAWAANKKKNLIVAGAGAGKTKVAVERAKLLSSKGIAPNRLLFLTFSKRATEEMQDRLSVFGNQLDTNNFPAVKTIHGFARDCYQYVDHTLEQVYKKEVGKPIFNNWEKALKEKMEKESKIEAKIYEWINIRKLIWFKLNPEYIYKSYQSSETRHSEPHVDTKSGIKVRSIGEQKIADFLFENKILFEYEKPVLCCDWPFRPDFYLPEVGSYIEYLGLWNVSNLEIRKEYRDAHESKRKQFEEHKDKLDPWANVDLFPEDLDSDLFKEKILEKVNYLKTLKKRGKFRQREKSDEKSIKKKMAEEITGNINFLMNIDDALKVNQNNIDQLKGKMPYVFHELIDLVKAMSLDVSSRLLKIKKKESNEMFEDLGAKFNSGDELFETIRGKYDYLFLDEFQDVTPLLFKFLKRFMKEMPFFAIGDERQAIYGFAGGTPHYIRNLAREIPGTKTKVLIYNYRSNKTIVETSLLFTNPRSIRSIAKDETETKIIIFRVEDELKQAPEVIKEIRERIGDLGLMVISRNTPAVNAVVEKYRKILDKETDELLTVHKSKGLEEKAVLVVNVVEGKDVFGKQLRCTIPSRDKDHPVIRYIRGNSLQDSIYEEEKRLFYVALSRAEEFLFIVTERDRESHFVSMINEKQKNVELVDLILK
jgi:DNA helicase-4